MLRRLTFALFLVLIGVPAFAQSDRGIEIVRVEGIVDARKVDFIIDSIDAAAASGRVEVVILQIDSRGFVAPGEDLDRLLGIISGPPVPLVAWVGPAPAVAYGGMLEVVARAPLALAAPGTHVGYSRPLIAASGGDGDRSAFVAIDGVVPAEDSNLFTAIGPETASPRQVVQTLDGVVVGGVKLSTLQSFPDSGVEGVTAIETVIREPGAIDSLLGLTTRPDVAFFLLVAGLTLAVFEFYAVGPGIAAVLAAICLSLAAHGIAVLPVRWWAIVLSLSAAALLAFSYQRGRLPVIDGVGVALLLVAGFAFTDAAPQFGPSIPGVLLSVVVVAFFFLIAMPTVGRSRFSAPTIGRESLIGRSGRAVSAVAPEGAVEIDGARWRATGHRESGIGPGDSVRVVGIDGIFLEVEPDREN